MTGSSGEDIQCVRGRDAVLGETARGPEQAPVPLALALPGDPTALLHQHDLLALYRPDGDRAVPVAVLA